MKSTGVQMLQVAAVAAYLLWNTVLSVEIHSDDKVTLSPKFNTTSPPTATTTQLTTDSDSDAPSVVSTSTSHITTKAFTSTGLASSSSSHSSSRSDPDKPIYERDVGDLTAAMCQSDDEFDAIVGAYKGFYGFDDGADDEGTNYSFFCKVESSIDASCGDILKERLNSTVLVVDGTVVGPKTYNKSYDVENGAEQFTFSFLLDYDTHHEANVSCLFVGEQANITSNLVNIGKVDELFKLEIEPRATAITVGDTYTLSCIAETERALEIQYGYGLKWRRGSDDSNQDNYKCEDENLCNETITSDPPASVLTIKTLKNATEAKEYTYSCTKTNYNSLQTQREYIPYAAVSIALHDKSWIKFVTGTAVFVLLLGVVGAGVVFIKRKRLRENLAVSIRMTEARENAVIGLRRQYSNDYSGGRRESEQVLLESISDIMERVSIKHSAWERDKGSLKIKEQIGMGNFGCVYVATMPNEIGLIETVAVKTIKEQGLEINALLEFEKEMDMMTTIRHNHIVNLLGICTVSLPFFIIMEYMENGQLNTYLTEYAPSKEMPQGGLSTCQLAWICQQPCDALEYLGSKSMVHRDVSARNCLVGKDLQVKLADFGLSRDTSDNAKNYYKKEGGMVPVKWMAPEALTYGKYTSANDVWAFGVLAWEVFSFGALPYQHLTNQQVIVNICKGERLDRPQMCPQDLWSKILQCWEDAPEERIMLSALLAFFRDYAQQEPRLLNFV